MSTSSTISIIVATTTLTACFGFGDDPAAQDACGDGVIDRDEECDDANDVAGDGCSATCTLEAATDCGDGRLDLGEQCDDGNLLANDGCSPTCRLESSGRMTLRQSTSDVIVPGHSAACRAQSTGATHQNGWMRRFVLADHGITRAFAIEEVTFGIEEAEAGGVAVSQPVSVRIHDYRAASVGDALDPQAMSERASINLMIADTAPTLVTRAIAADIAAGGTFVVEVFVPDGETLGHKFRIGTNMDGETREGYLAAPKCGLDLPAALSTVVTTRKINLVMNVTGTVK